MTTTELKEEIIKYSKEIGIDKIGFASADPFVTLKERLVEHRRLGYESGFEDMPRRVPDLTKVKGMIGYSPRRSLDDILTQVIGEFARK